ncbi:IS5 family transposase [Polaromonas glacialis]|uniref:IS5 family transposase n=1 Tax=Polaromonas glacialis TaxID=866564 RepID=UPI0004981F91|nr:IS5 family transposase [Polaromonas glacialis]
MPKDTLLPSQPKGVYRVKNWPEYNAGLIERGNVTVWMDERMFSPALQTPGGRAQAYSDTVIQMLLTLKSVYRLPLRALQGFAISVQRLAMPDLAVPNYSTLSRRAKSLRVTLPVLRKAGEAVHLLVDSTGLKLFGEGEWKVRKHGYSKRRSWRKVHLALDAKTGQVCAVLMTHRDVDDASVLPELLAQLPPETKVEIVGGDGAYDSQAARAAIAGCGALALTPPVEGAVHWPASQAGASERNAAIDHIAQSVKQDWKDKSGYHCRSLVENLMYRLKTLTGDRLWARDVDVQDAEVAVRVGIINPMMVLARPDSVRVA